jgi:glycosyltransferase involved in cell wall biosynthesis
MRIAVITSSYPRFEGDGAAPFIKSICEQLVEAGHAVEVAAPFDELCGPMETHGVALRRFRYSPLKSWHIMGHARSLDGDIRLRPLAILLLPFFLVAAFVQLWKITGRQKSEVVYAHWVIPNGLPAAAVARLRHVPLMISLHGSDIFVASSNFIYRAAARWIFKRCAAVTACSPELRDKAMALGAPPDTHLVPYGADPQLFTPANRSTEKRHRQGISDGAVVVSSLGRLVYKKGLDVLIEAMPAVLAQCPQVYCLLGGDGPLRAELERQAGLCGVREKIIFAGRVPWNEAPDFLACVDIFVLPSVRDKAGNMDGLPNVMLEAMACGVPVIASNLGGVPLVVRNNENGRLVGPGDVRALAAAIIELAQDAELRGRLSCNGRISIEQEFNWKKVVERLIGYMEQAVGKTHRPEGEFDENRN